MATVVHVPVSNLVPTSTAGPLTLAPWVLESLLMLIAVIASIAAFSVGYQVG